MRSAARIALLIAVGACAVAEKTRDSAISAPTVVADSALPTVIDTRLPKVLGIALRENTREAQWCLHTSRPDVRPNDFVKVVFAGGRRFSGATVGAPKAGCLRSDTIANVRNFALRMDSIPQFFGWFGVVVRSDVDGTLDVTRGIYAAELDADPGVDYIQDCSGARGMHLFITSGDTLGPVRWHYDYRQFSYDDNSQPTCNGRFGEPLPDTTNYEEDPVPEPPGLMNFPGSESADSTDISATWFALRQREAGWELAETKVTYGPAGDVCGEETGGRSAIPSIGGQMFAMFTNLPGLRAGPVTSAEISDTLNKYLIPNSGATVWGDTIRVVMSGKLSLIRSAPFGKYGLRILLDRDDKPLTLYSAKTQDEGSWSVIWAGDLDRDGQLDLLISATRKYSIDAWQLHLSSYGKGTDVWLPVARHFVVGC